MAYVKQAGLTDKRDIKIFILYLMRAIDCPLEYEEIHDISVGGEVVNSFDFTECFAELLDAGNIAECEDEGVRYFVITTQGIHVADNLSSELLRSIREQSLRSARRYINFRHRGTRVESSLAAEPDESSPDGEKVTFKCSITEKNGELMSLSLRCDSKNQADRMKYYFDNYPEEIFRRLMLLLTTEPN